MNRYIVTFQVEIAIDQNLLDSVLTDEWRAVMFPAFKPEDIASHIAFNMVRGCSLSEIDGYADQPEKRAMCGELETVDVEAVVERKTSARRKKR